MTTGLLLINLGTPDEPTTPAVRRYLAEFLSDPRVVDIHPVGRWLLLHGIILRTRPAKSAHAYRQVWDPQRGSPLLSHSKDLAAAVAAKLGTPWRVELAMRYGNPSIESRMTALRDAGVDRIVALPLYPQYAASSTATSLARVMELASGGWDTIPLTVLPAFYDDPGFITAFATVAAPALADLQPDHVLFSYHGLPERQIIKSDPTKQHCLKSATCCDAITSANRNCYRAQCYATTRALAAKLGLTEGTYSVSSEGTYSVSFQSRLGRTPWITPHTDVVIDELAKAGKKRVAVLCPAFVADCLETLEEIGMRARDQFKAAGGDELRLVPSLNATPAWVDAVCAMATR